MKPKFGAQGSFWRPFEAEHGFFSWTWEIRAVKRAATGSQRTRRLLSSCARVESRWEFAKVR